MIILSIIFGSFSAVHSMKQNTVPKHNSGTSGSLDTNSVESNKRFMHRTMEKFRRVKQCVGFFRKEKICDLGSSPLGRAARTGNLICAEMLIFFGANINVSNDCDQSPLHEATKWGKIKMARLLLQNGANVNAVAEKGYGEIPLHNVGELNNMGKIDATKCIEFVDLFVKHGVQINKGNHSGQTILHWIVHREGMSPCIRRIIECGADPNARDRNGDGPLHELSNYYGSGDPKTADELIECGTNVNAHNYYESSTMAPHHLIFLGATALHMATLLGNSRMVKSLVLKHGANVLAIDHYGRKPVDILDIDSYRYGFAHRHIEEDNEIRLILEEAEHEQQQSQEN